MMNRNRSLQLEKLIGHFGATTMLSSLLQFYRCFLALLCCENPRHGSSVKSSSKVATKVMRGAAVTGQRHTHDFLFMVASLGQPATTVPQLGPSFEATNEITKPPSSDIHKPVVVSLVTQFEG